VIDATVAPQKLTLTTAVLTGSLAAVGCGILAARPAVVAAVREPAIALAVVFAVMLIVGALAPLPTIASPPISRSPRVIATTVAVGIAAFSAARVLVGGHAPARLTLPVVLANTLAAIAEEAWFRRLCFGLLAPAGSVIAVAGSAALFAAVHVSTYGFWILPLDLAAGVLLGWQRSVTGSWGASAVTHAIGNVVVLL
jgi:membrane protease YdiL (CAAX protease family)